MFRGKVLEINVAPEHGAPIDAIQEARLVPGEGIEGDKIFNAARQGKKPRPNQEVTLVEVEAVRALERESGIALTPADTRRNLVTEGVPLNHLVGREFRVGEAVLKGHKLCEPCGHLEGMTQKGVVQGLLHRGGLRAEIVKEGVVRPGDPVEEAGDG